MVNIIMIVIVVITRVWYVGGGMGSNAWTRESVLEDSVVQCPFVHARGEIRTLT